MSKLMRKRQIAAKIESVEGTAEALAATDAKLLVYSPETAFDPDSFERTPSKSSGSHLGFVTGARPGTQRYNMEMRGSGAAATAPEWAKLWQACGNKVSTLYSITIGVVTSGPFQHGEAITGTNSGAIGRVIINTATGTTTLYFIPIGTVNFQNGEVITGGTSAATVTTGSTPSIAGKVIEPLFSYGASGIPSLTQAGYHDGVRKLLKGCRGNLKLSYSGKGEPVMQAFDFRGVEAGITDLSMLTGIVYETTKPPAFQGVTALLDTYTPKIHAFDFDLGNTITDRPDAADSRNILSFIITGKKPVFTITVENMSVADFDYHTKCFNNTEIPIDLAWGAVAGNKFRFYAAKGQITKPEEGEKDGLETVKLTCSINGRENLDDVEYALLCL